MKAGEHIELLLYRLILNHVTSLYIARRMIHEDTKPIESYFTKNEYLKGYYSADSFCEIFPVIASDKVKRVIKGLWEYRSPITLL